YNRQPMQIIPLSGYLLVRSAALVFSGQKFPFSCVKRCERLQQKVWCDIGKSALKCRLCL
ncbi:MAG: hypothetical protein J1F40_08695, partial [Prevotellaceae bacterium]|nr:hypothetical protein [Prevotellaceae bacterium]